MRTLLNKIRKLLKDRRTRRLWSRTVSVVAALVVFVTTYALVLPAITMERQAYCGMEAHQHTDECFERQLVCTIPESPGHRHEDSCYTARQEFFCTLEEHIHGDGCYDEEGNLICEIPEHTHEEGTCWKEVSELTCTLEESDGHQHNDSCYENVLVCGKEVHTHSEACYENPEELLETAAVATTQQGSYGISIDDGFDSAGADNNGETYGSGDEIGWSDSDEYGNAARSDVTDMTASDGENDGTALGGENDGSAGSQEAADGLTDPDNAVNGMTAAGADAAGADASGPDVAGTDNLSEEAQQGLTSAGINEEEDRYVPQLDPLAFDSALRSRTGIYYYHVREGEVVEDSSLITEWKKVDKNTELGPNDLLRVYLSYTIPAGSLNETNPTASYRLPANLHLTDDQVNGINAVENGIAAAYIDYNTLTVIDPDNYHRYLGAEAVEGTRTPDQTLEEYLAQNKGGSGSNDTSGSGNGASGNQAGQEFISATVRAQNVYDTEGLYGEKGAYLGQDLIFTFSPYTIEKNQHTYDASGQPTSAGQKVRGWFALDFNLGQVDLSEPFIEDVNSRELRTADIVFAEKDDARNIDEISTAIKVVTAENDERVEENPDDAENIENTENSEETGEEQPEEGAEDSAENPTVQEAEAGEDATDADNEDKSDADAEEKKDKDKTGGQDDELEKTIMPAMSFEDSIRVRTGRPAGVEDGSAGSAAASAAEALPDKAKVTVRVEADEGTFPAGTTMVLSAVEDMDAVAETVKETVENSGGNESAHPSGKSNQENTAVKNGSGTTAAPGAGNKNTRTYGFQAVDISFHDADGNEIEPAKPVRVALTSSIVEQIKSDKDADSSTPISDPVVVHVDDEGNAQKMDLIAPEEVEPAQGKNEEELREEMEKAKEEAEKAALEEAEKDAAGHTSGPDQEAGDDSENAAPEENDENPAPEGGAEKTAPAEAVDPDQSAVEVNEKVDENQDQNQENTNPDDQPTAGEDTANVAADEEYKEPTVFFDTDSFSVYAIVYTVDFHWEIDGKEYKFCITGGTGVSLKEVLSQIHVVKGDDDTGETATDLSADAFINKITEVTFSDPDLLYVYKVEQEITTLGIKQGAGLNPEYSALMTRQEIDEADEKVYTAPDWALLTLKPFFTEESLKITMADGEIFSILVTDAQSDAFHNTDGTVQTIANPAGTTFDVFDYWISDTRRNSTARAAWPGTVGQIGTGNNSGINASTSDTSHGHALKFTPANGSSVIDGTLDYGSWTRAAVDGGPGLNSWTKNANPRQGIVTGTQVDGYPKLSGNGTLGATNESLAYLFNTSYHAGKEAFTKADQLLYVDPEGYYMFDSNDFNAQFNKTSKTFTLTNQTAAVGDARGFWPFGTQVYWHGMHMKTQFSMPADGKVLGPTGKYNDMTFEFQGDDDTWVYVDGVLVGDGGGIHNQTFISVNFRDGTVTVDGMHDVKDEYRTTWSQTRYLDELYTAAGIYNQFEWVDSPTVPGHKTFAPGTYHSFDMFYLERGGGESNLHIRYNLVSTADFTAHKSFHNTSNDRLYRDEFQFEIIGLDGQYKGDTLTDANKRAIMPKGGSASGVGIVASPRKVYYEASGGNPGYTSYITGVSEDGNVNFGQADFDSAEMHDCDTGNPSTYRYIIREVVPDDAVNADGKTWAASTDEEKEEGGYVKNGLTYDGRIYYMTATVISWTEDGTPVYGLSKKYYTDSTFETEDTSTKFASFINGYVQPLTLKVNKKSDSNKLLSGAQFSLVRAKHDVQHGENNEVISEKWIPRPGAAVRTGTTAQGVLTFDSLTEGHYILEETAPPTGYAKRDPARWLLTLTKQDSATKILLVPTIMPLNADGTLQAGAQAQELDVNSSNMFEHEVLNDRLPRGDLVVEKKWMKPDGETEYTMAELEALGVDGTTVTGELRRRATEETQQAPVTVTIKSKFNNQSDAAYRTRWQRQVQPGSTVTFSMAVNSTGYPIQNPDGTYYTTSTGASLVKEADQNIDYTDDYYGPSQNSAINKPAGHVFSLRDITEDVEIYGVFTPQTNQNHPDIGFKMLSFTEPEETVGTHEIDEAVKAPGTDSDVFTLDRSNNWTVTWTSAQLNEGDHDFEYYLRNVSEPSLEGFTFISDPEVTTNTTTGKATYSVKNIKEGPKTDLTVRKVWGDNLNHSGDSITYKIQRQDLDASGSPVGSPYDYIATGEQTAATYTLSSSDSFLGVSWQKHHTGLPATNGKDETDPNYRAYKYTVVETGSPANYVADPPFMITDTSQNEHYEVNVIKNNPTDARVTVEKKWMNDEQTAELEEGIPEGAYITGTLKRSYTWQEATGVTVRVYYRVWNSGQAGNPTLMYTYNDVQDGGTFNLWAVDANGNEPQLGVQVNGARMPQTGPARIYRVNNNWDKTTNAFVTTVNGNTDILLDWDHDKAFQTRVYYDVEYPQATGGGETHNETETIGDFRLDAANEWKWAWTDRELDQDHVYTYFFDNVQEHTADGSVVVNFDGFLPPEVGSLTQGTDGKWTATIKNVQEPARAALQLKKQVTINDFDPEHSTVTDKTVADGTYIINVTGKDGTETAGQSYTVKITITNGEAVSATVKDNTVPGAVDTPVTLTEEGILEIPEMIPGEYTVTEAEDSKTVLTSINSTGEASVTDLDNRKATITLLGGDENVQLVTLTNNYADNHETDIAHVSVRKTFAGIKPGMSLPEGFYILAEVTAAIDGSQQVFNYKLTGETDAANGVIWNQSTNEDGDVVWNWRIAIHGLKPDAQVEVEEFNYTKTGYDVTHQANPSNNGGDGTSYTGTVTSSTVVQGTAAVITQQNSLVFPLNDIGNMATIFVARIVPSQTSLVISKNKLNLSERAALEAQLHSMPNAGDWYNNTVPLYYSFEDAANHKITVRNRSEVTYSETTPGDPSTGQIRFDKKCQWDMVGTVTMTYVEGRPADFNFVNSYSENGVPLDIVKLDATDMATPLEKAQFRLRKLDPEGRGSYLTGDAAFTKDSGETDGEGKTAIEGIRTGYYEVSEIKVPDGYVQIEDSRLYIRVSDGVIRRIIVTENDPETTDIDESLVKNWTVVGDNDDGTLRFHAARAAVADNPATTDVNEAAPAANATFTVGNTPGAALPASGGPGTSLYLLLGGALTAIAGALLVRRRRIS